MKQLEDHIVRDNEKYILEHLRVARGRRTDTDTDTIALASPSRSRAYATLVYTPNDELANGQMARVSLLSHRSSRLRRVVSSILADLTQVVGTDARS